MTFRTNPWKAALLAASLLATTPALALDLVGSYDAALGMDPDLLAAEQAQIAGREKAVQGNALLLPKVNLTASLMQVENESETDLPPAFNDLIKSDSRGAVHEAELQLQQPLYDASAWAERRQLREQAELSDVRYGGARQDLMERVSEAYFGVLLAQESLRVVQAEKAAMGMQRDRAQARFDVGKSTIADLQEAQARYDGVVTREVSAQGTLEIRLAQYREVTGTEAHDLGNLNAEIALAPPIPDDLAVWQARGLAHNPQVLTRQGELRIATAEIDKYRLSARPTLDLVASYGHQGQDGGLSPAIAADSSDTSVVGLQLSLPIYTGGALESRRRESVAKEQQARQELSAAQRDTRLRVQNAWLEVKTGMAKVQSVKQSLRSAETALEAAVLGRDVGIRTELDVLDAQQRSYAAQLDLAQARHDYLMGRIHLASAAGVLDRGDLEGIAGQLAR